MIAPTLPVPPTEKKEAVPTVVENSDDWKPWQVWRDGNEAKKAAVDSGWCRNDSEARNSLLNSLEAITKQKEQWIPSEQALVFKHFYDKHMKRKSELKEAA